MQNGALCFSTFAEATGFMFTGVEALLTSVCANSTHLKSENFIRQEIRLWKKNTLDEFVDGLAAIFSGNQFFPGRLAVLTKTTGPLMQCARLVVNKACDECGLAA